MASLTAFINLVDKFSPSINKMSKSADGFTNSMAKLAVAATGAITSAVTGIAGIAAKSANAYQDAMNTLQTSTGATNKEMESLSEIMKGVYADNFGEDWNDVAESLATVNRFLSGTGENIESATKNAITFRDTFGVDVSESMRATNTLMKQFGISSTEAFNLMAQGQQQGLDYSGELIDSINEYSVQFAKVGLDAEDMFNIFNSGVQNGAWNLDKIGDAVKEFSIRAIDGSNTTADGFKRLGMNADEMAGKFAMGGDTAKQAFYQVIQAIKDMNDPVEQSIVGVDLFGTMWEDLGPQVVTNLGQIQDGFDKTKNTMEQINQIKYNSFGSALVGIMRQVETSLLPLGAAVLPMLNNFANWFKEEGTPKIQSFATAIQNNIGPIEGAISSVFNSILPMLSSIITLIGEIATTYFGNMSNSSINLQSILESLVSGGFELLKGSLEFIRDNSGLVTGLIIGITSAYLIQKGVVLGLAVASGVKTAAQWASIAADKAETIAIMALYAKDYILAGAQWAVTAAQWAMNSALLACPVTWVVVAIAALVGALIYLYKNNETVRNAINTAWEWLKTNVIAAVTAIKDWCISAWTNIKAVVIPIIQSVADFIVKAWENIKIVTAFVWELIKAVIESVWVFISSIVKAYINIYVAVITTAWNVIKAVTMTVWNAVKDFLSGVWNGIVTFMQPIIQGISDFITSTWETIKNVTSTVFSAISTFFTTIWSGIVTFLTPIIMGIANFISATWNTIQIATSTIWNLISQGLSIVWNFITSLVTTVISGWINIITGAWNIISTVSTTVWNGISSFFSYIWGIISNIFTTVISAISSTVSSIWNGIKNVTSSVWNGISSVLSGIVNGIKNTISNVFNGVLSVASSIWNSVKSAITNPITAAVNFVKEQINKITGFFKSMKIDFPKIKMPHFKITGSFSLAPPSVPKLGVEWYAKGTNNAKKGPAIVGEKGPELLYMNGGEKVIPNNKTEKMLNSSLNTGISNENLQPSTQQINQAVNYADVKEPSNFIQTIDQVVNRATIPEIEGQTQNVEQNIIQKLRAVKIPSIDDIKQRIIQNTIPDNSTKSLDDVSNTIIDKDKADTLRNTTSTGDSVTHNEKYITIEKLFDNVAVQDKESIKKLLEQLGAFLEEELFNGGDAVYEI